MISTEAYMDIVALKRQGHSLRWIARKLGIHRTTVKKHLEKQGDTYKIIRFPGSVSRLGISWPMKTADN